MPITHMLAPRMAITDLPGSMAASLSEPGPGIAAAGTADMAGADAAGADAEPMQDAERMQDGVRMQVAERLPDVELVAE